MDWTCCARCGVMREGGYLACPACGSELSVQGSRDAVERASIGIRVMADLGRHMHLHGGASRPLTERVEVVFTLYGTAVGADDA